MFIWLGLTLMAHGWSRLKLGSHDSVRGIITLLQTLGFCFNVLKGAQEVEGIHNAYNKYVYIYVCIALANPTFIPGRREYIYNAYLKNIPVAYYNNITNKRSVSIIVITSLVTTRELTYPFPRHFSKMIFLFHPLPRMGHVSSLEGSTVNQ